MITDKNTIRKQLRTKLHNVTSENKATASQTVATKIKQSKIFANSQIIACYIPINNELDTKAIIEAIWEQNKDCYLPASCPKKHGNLCFAKYMLGDLLLKNRRFPEPVVTIEKMIPPQDLELVIVPIIGFNQNNFRLGQGVGLYDKTFAFKRGLKPNSSPYLIGIGYSWQLAEFETSKWDIPMDEIIVG